MRQVFFGRALPERADVCVSPPITLSGIDGSQFKITASILKSQIHAICEWDESIDLLSFKNILEYQLRILIDVLGLTLNCGFDLELISAIDLATGCQVVFGVDERLETTNVFPSILEMATRAFGDQCIQIAVESFRLAIRTPHRTSFYCFHAIEAVRRGFVGGDSSLDEGNLRRESWRNLRDQLRIQEETIREVEPVATDIRHGGTPGQPWLARKRHMEIAHEVIRRYIYFSMNGRLPLYEDDFPAF